MLSIHLLSKVYMQFVWNLLWILYEKNFLFGFTIEFYPIHIIFCTLSMMLCLEMNHFWFLHSASKSEISLKTLHLHPSKYVHKHILTVTHGTWNELLVFISSMVLINQVHLQILCKVFSLHTDRSIKTILIFILMAQSEFSKHTRLEFYHRS